MKRYTIKKEKQYYLANSFFQNENGIYGEAIEQLAIYENVIQTIENRLIDLENDLQQLKEEQKVKSMKFNQKIGEKMLYERILTMIEFERQAIKK